MSNPLVAHVDVVRRARPGLPDDLPDDLEAQLLERLQPWYERLAEAQKAYQAGELERPAAYAKERSAVYAATPFTDDEREAAFDLYVMLARYVAKQVAYWYERYKQHIRVITLDDALADSIELFYRSLAAYDRSQGIRLISWLYVDMRSLLRDYMEDHACIEESLDDVPEPEAAGGDLEGALAEFLDFDEWAEGVCQTDEHRTIWEYLSAAA